MSAKPDATKVLEEALRLDGNARAFVAEALLESLDVDDDTEISEAWLEEIRRRCADIDSGKIKLIESEHVIHELRGKYSQ